MREKPREKTPTLNTLGFLPPHQKSSDGLDAAVRGLKDLDGHESAAGLRRLLDAESGASHGKDSPTRRDRSNSASEGRGRPSGAVETSGAKQRPEQDAPRMMDASDTTPTKGESASGESYSQTCLKCGAEFVYLGSLGEDDPVECQECGYEALPYGFWECYVRDQVDTVSVEIEVPARLLEAARHAEEEVGIDHGDFLIDNVELEFSFVERGSQ